MRGPPIRVAIASRAVYPYHGFGGLERHVYYLAVHLRRLGLEVHLFASPPTVERGRQEENTTRGMRGVSLHFSPYSLLPLRANSVPDRITNYPVFAYRQGRQVCCFAASGGVDVVHAHGLSAFGCAWQRRKLGVTTPLVSNPHGMEDFKTTDIRRRVAYGYFRALYRYGSRLADRVVATDEAMVEEIQRHLGVSPARVVTLPNAIDVDDCLAPLDESVRRRLGSRFGLTAGWPVMLSVGRLEQNKGFHVAVKALACLRAALPESWRWVVVGEGSRRGDLERMTCGAGIADHVLFAGSVGDSELHNLYEMADLFLHPTLYEGSSIVTLEAMVHGLPVVAGRVGGIPDKIEDGINGFLVAPGDHDNLAAAIQACLSRPESMKAMGEAGRRRAMDGFSWPKVARRTVDEYERLLEGARCRRRP